MGGGGGEGSDFNSTGVSCPLRSFGFSFSGPKEKVGQIYL